MVLLPGRYPSTNQRAHLDLPEADGDGGSGGETFDDWAGDEIQQEPWPANREHTELIPEATGDRGLGEVACVGLGLRTGGPHALLGLVWRAGDEARVPPSHLRRDGPWNAEEEMLRARQPRTQVPWFPRKGRTIGPRPPAGRPESLTQAQEAHG